MVVNIEDITPKINQECSILEGDISYQEKVARMGIATQSAFTKHDPVHCMTPGLFRSLKKGDRKRLKLEVVWEDGKGRSIKFWGPEPLGADDLRILQGLVALGCRSKTPMPLMPINHPEQHTFGGVLPEFGSELQNKMQPKWDALLEKAVWVETNYASLARELGLNPRSGSVIKSIRTCLERLWAVSIIAHDKGRQMGFHLLSYYSDDENSGGLFFALNPCISRIILEGHPFTYIDMREIRLIKSDSTRILHQRLCGWLSPGHSKTIKIETMMSYVWPESPQHDFTERWRVAAIKSALQELADLGWKIQRTSKAYEIGRPNMVEPMAERRAISLTDPKKSHNFQEDKSSNAGCHAKDISEKTDRKRGRPKKLPLDEMKTLPEDAL